jgi:polysaccharide biosynthesis transport protein
LPTSPQIEESDLSLVARAIRHRIWVVIVCTVIATAAAVALTLHEEKKYESASALLLHSTDEIEQQVDTNLQLMSLPRLAKETSESLDGVSQGEVEEAVHGVHEGESSIIKVVAESGSPDRAAEISTAFAENFVAFRAPNVANGESGERIKVIEKATPSSSPVSPKPTRNVIFGFLIGLALGLSLALLLEQMDRRVKREDDLAEATGLPRLAAVPKLKSFSEKRLGREPLSPAETEVFRMLRANLRYFNVQRKIKSVLVTSAEPGEGKSLVALGLALAAASSGEHVLLIEADLRDPGLSSMLDLPKSGGLSRALLSDDAEVLASAVVRVDASELGDAVSKPLDVLPAGAIPPNPTELIESQRMKDLIGLAERAYDLVVLDTPPVLSASDAIPLFPLVSGVLAVSGIGVSTRRSAASLADVLKRSGAPTLGVVANMVEGNARSMRGYGYGRAPEISAAAVREGAVDVDSASRVEKDMRPESH